MFGHVAASGQRRGLAFLFYSYADVSGGALLIALVAGDAALAHEERGSGECAEEVLVILRAMWKSRWVVGVGWGVGRHMGGERGLGSRMWGGCVYIIVVRICSGL